MCGKWAARLNNEHQINQSIKSINFLGQKEQFQKKSFLFQVLQKYSGPNTVSPAVHLPHFTPPPRGGGGPDRHRHAGQLAVQPERPARHPVGPALHPHPRAHRCPALPAGGAPARRLQPGLRGAVLPTDAQGVGRLAVFVACDFCRTARGRGGGLIHRHTSAATVCTPCSFFF